MRTARRGPSVRGHGPGWSPATSLPRSSDVAVTCADRAGAPAAGGGPAARGFELEPSDGTPGRPAMVDVVLGADLVAARAAEIHQVVDRVLQAVPAVLRLRLDGVQRFDAAGLGLLLRVHERARKQGVVLVCACPPRQLIAVLQRTRLDRVLTVDAGEPAPSG